MVGFLRALDRKLLRDLWRLKGQGIAVGIIIACGVGIMIMALGSLASLEESRSTYYERYRFADVFADVKRAPNQIVGEIREIDGVKSAETRITRIVTLDLADFNEPANAQLVSLPDEGQPTLNNVMLHEGRWPDLARPEEAIVSRAFAQEHDYHSGDRIRAIFNGRTRDIEIVGIGDSPEYVWTLGIGGLLPDDKRFGVFWMRRQALERAFDLEGAFNNVTVSLLPNAVEADVISRLDNMLAPYGAVGAYNREDQFSNAFVESEMGQLVAMAAIIPPVFLVVSALLIHAILSRLIAVERQQIGLLKAFGFSNLEVAAHYVKLAVVLSLGGVLAGFVLGRTLARLLTHLYSNTMRFPEIVHVFEPSAFVIGAGAAIVAAVIGALNAALKAAALQPAEAMNPAPPTVYRRGGILPLWLTNKLDEPTRMIVRHITRWPIRAAMTTFGIAASMALLVGTLFAFDSTDEMIDTIYYRTDVYDAAVTFAEIEDETALSELDRVPGVLEVEPTRDVYVRFRNGVHSERGSITGIRSDAKYKRLLDRKETPVSVAESGLTMTSHLASLLNIGLGERLTVEFLEGKRPVLDIPITAVVEEYIGHAAYMNIEELGRVMGESRTITGAFLALDPDLSIEFNDAILDRPQVASVALRSAVIETFNETLEETITIMMMIYAVIGGAIAAGVVYNAARISLTERGRELASLRVLGFTHGEVSYVLLGEQAMLAIIAIPIGSLLGTAFAHLIVLGMSTDLYRVPYVLEPSTRGFAAAVVLVAVFLAAVLVANRIRNLDLIEVLKTRE
ncbi:MAG: FtsX-like permease family protein [Henriciella sp.]|nr:FtsX-like permease family protein [Henriciella sp.]